MHTIIIQVAGMNNTTIPANNRDFFHSMNSCIMCKTSRRAIANPKTKETKKGNAGRSKIDKIGKKAARTSPNIRTYDAFCPIMDSNFIKTMDLLYYQATMWQVLAR